MQHYVAVLLLATAEALSTTTAPRAITGAWPQAFPAKDLCSNCGLCKTDVGIASVTDACAFIGDGMARAEGLEERPLLVRVHQQPERLHLFFFPVGFIILYTTPKSVTAT